MKPIHKYYLAKNTPLTKEEALKLISELKPEDLESKAFEPNPKSIKKVNGFLVLTIISFIALSIFGWTSHQPTLIVNGILGSFVFTFILLGYKRYNKNKKQLAQTEALFFIRHLENRLKLSEALKEIDPSLSTTNKSKIDSVEEYIAYYKKLSTIQLN